MSEQEAVYDSRYEHDYMREWPEGKKHRVTQLLHEINLPPLGRALDFGCGSGVFSAVLRDALPGWEIWGSEISEVALTRARGRVSGVRFVSTDETRGQTFDLVLSHHVLEHVIDLPKTLGSMAAITARGGRQLHILPCGNSGSLEHALARAAPGGIDPDTGRFFYEDPTHERRLTTSDLAAVAAPFELSIERALYANQHAGAVDWITQSLPHRVFKMTRHSKSYCVKLTSLAALRLPTRVVDRLRQGSRRRVHYVMLALAPLYPLSKPLDLLLTHRSESEWNDRKTDPGGSEQYVLLRRIQYERPPTPSPGTASPRLESDGD